MQSQRSHAPTISVHRCCHPDDLFQPQRSHHTSRLCPFTTDHPLLAFNPSCDHRCMVTDWPGRPTTELACPSNTATTQTFNPNGHTPPPHLNSIPPLTHGGQGDSLVPPYKRGSSSLSRHAQSPTIRGQRCMMTELAIPSEISCAGSVSCLG